MPSHKPWTHDLPYSDASRSLNPTHQSHSITQLDLKKDSKTLVDQARIYYEGQLLPEFQRLVVIIPNQIIDNIKFCRKIRAMALPGRKNIMLLSMISDTEDEMAAKRLLTTLSALLRDSLYKVETQVHWGKSWIKTVQKVIVNGDLIVCPREMTYRITLGKRECLSQKICAKLLRPVFAIEGIFHDKTPNQMHFFKNALFWIVSLGIIALFFFFEKEISPNIKGWVNQMVIILAIILETIVLIFWNSIAG